MLTDSITEIVRRRWQAPRPFEGHTKESLIRKIDSPAVREEVKEQIRRELQLRSTRALSG